MPERDDHTCFDVRRIADHNGDMHEPHTASNLQTLQSHAGNCAEADHRAIDPRAVLRGIAVGAGGALVMTTLIGVAAVVGMANEGLTPETIVGQMRSQWDIRLFLALADLLLAFLGGYTAAVMAGRGHLLHALCAGGGTLGANLLLIGTCGSPLPPWLATAGLVLVVPGAALGGYLASGRN